MTNEQLTEKYKKFAEPGGPLHGKFEVVGVDWCGHHVDGLSDVEAHPFCVGPKHVAYASDHCGGELGEEAINASGIGCAHRLYGQWHGPLCNRTFSAHKSERGLMLRLCRSLGNKEAADALFPIKEELIKDKIDGCGFVNMPNEYTIAKPEVPTPEGGV